MNKNLKERCKAYIIILICGLVITLLMISSYGRFHIIMIQDVFELFIFFGSLEIVIWFNRCLKND